MATSSDPKLPAIAGWHLIGRYPDMTGNLIMRFARGSETVEVQLAKRNDRQAAFARTRDWNVLYRAPDDSPWKEPVDCQGLLTAIITILEHQEQGRGKPTSLLAGVGRSNAITVTQAPREVHLDPQGILDLLEPEVHLGDEVAAAR